MDDIVVAVSLRHKDLTPAQLDLWCSSKHNEISYYKDIRRIFPSATTLKQRKPSRDNGFRLFHLTVPKNQAGLEDMLEISVLPLTKPPSDDLQALPIVVRILEEDDCRSYPLVGKIFAKGWQNSDNTDIADLINETYNQPIVENVERFFKRVNGEKVPTGLLKIYFNKTILKELPKTLKVQGRNFLVSPYISQPRGCAKCLEFGHMANKCASTTYRCKNCGGTAVKDTEASLTSKKLVFKNHVCQVPKVCPNCAKVNPSTNINTATNHSPFADVCPFKRRELKIKTLAANNNLRMSDARKLYMEQQIETRNPSELEETCANLDLEVSTVAVQMERTEARAKILEVELEKKTKILDSLLVHENTYREKIRTYIQFTEDLINKLQCAPDHPFRKNFVKTRRAYDEMMEVR